ncbi:hypothetical protein SLS63_008913 [Diaporthe eres]|uniref:Nephrocystin 3-like N-terminal domain-containing protein n=1 Tax=Diaporthe eres TaxID=83184 RepID=A0ABR1P196_DIAER
MSGLEGLAGLGLACNIFQVISFGRETLGLVKSVYRDGTLDNSLTDKITAIQVVASNIIDVNIPQSGNQEKKLVDVTKKCTGVARDLQEEIAFLVGQNGQGSLRATLKIAAKANWRKRRLDRMEKALSDAEQLMQTTLLAWIFEALQVRETVVRQSGKTEKAIRAHVTRTSAKFERKFEYQVEQASRQRLRESLLKSLKYPGMNERANQIENAHERTFRWLFADADNLSYPDSNDQEDRISGSKDTENQDVRGKGDPLDHSTDDKSKARPPVMVWSSFTDWLQSDHSIYWIMGKPGSGKSTLAKFILSEPRTKMALENWRSDAIIRSIKGMLCSVIYQLVLRVPSALQYASANIAGLSLKDADTDCIGV